MSKVQARFVRAIAAAIGAMVLLGTGLAGSSVAAASPVHTDPPFAAPSGPGYHEHRGFGGETDVNVCSDDVGAGLAHCNARVRTDDDAKRLAPSAPGGVAPNVNPPTGNAYGPADLQAAYQTASATGGAGKTVAIVDAYDDPNAEADLAAYRSAYGLPPCTTANGCFRKVNQSGGTSYPTANKGWAQEIALDLDMVSAVCPNCKILLVEASSNSLTNLGAAVNRAWAMGAVAISNSYGASESWSEASYASTYYNHPGVLITASSGDAGYGVQFPAAAPGVLAVGGTRLTRSGTGFSETAWSGAGSGCSAYISKPSWQKDTGCSRRTVADVSAVADPATGVFVYNTYGGDPGFMMFGGTSVASPLVAAMYALAGNPTSTSPVNSYPYLHPNSLNDVTSGSNGSCSVTYLCTARTGYDGPTGLGSPRGIGAFLPAGVAATPDFSIGAAPSAVALHQGASSAVAVSVGASGGFAGAVSLSTSVTPATGVTATVNPSSITLPGSTTATLNLAAASSAPAGTYTVTVTATGPGSLSHSTTVTVTVAQADFSLTASPTSLFVTSGTTSSVPLTLGSIAGFTGEVDLSAVVSPADPGLTAGFSAPAVSLPTTTSSTLTLSADPTSNGVYTVTVTGTPAGGGAAHTAVVTVTTGPQDFSLGVSPRGILVPRGSRGSATVTITPISGFANPVQLAVSGLGPGESAGFSSNPTGPGSTTITVLIPWTDVPRTKTLTITATSGALSHSATLSVTIS